MGWVTTIKTLLVSPYSSKVPLLRPSLIFLLPLPQTKQIFSENSATDPCSPKKDLFISFLFFKVWLKSSSLFAYCLSPSLGCTLHGSRESYVHYCVSIAYKTIPHNQYMCTEYFPNYIRHRGGVEQRMVALGKYVEVIPRSLYIQKWQPKVKKDSEESPAIKYTHNTSAYVPTHPRPQTKFGKN